MNRRQIAQELSLIGKRFATTAAIIFALIGLNTIPASAGSLTPTGPPTTPTMRSLEQLKPTWDKIIPDAAQRFVDALDGSALLDKETGLVWQKTVSQTQLSWVEADKACVNNVTGNRSGWRLPTVHELMSILEPYLGLMQLPANVLFKGIPPYSYWTSSPYPGTLDSSYYVYFDLSIVNNTLTGASAKGYSNSLPTAQLHFWCVRGGQ